MSPVERSVAALAHLSSDQLRRRWSELTATPVPKISPALLRLAVAWELQARAHGGIPRATTRTLDQLARALTRTQVVAPGTRLVREWNGTAHVVVIDETGVLRWDNREWRSLSEVARGCCQSNANSSPHDAPGSLRAAA